MLRSFFHRLPRRTSPVRKRTNIRFEGLENRYLFAADLLSIDAQAPTGSEGSGDVSGEIFVVSGEGNDLPVESDGVDVLRGGAGNDVLLGNRGNDVVLSQDGNDLLIVNNGDGSDFGEVDAGGGPHVRVLDGSSQATDDSGDGVVDAADFSLWRNHLGDTPSVDSFYTELGGESTNGDLPMEQISFNYSDID